MATVNLTWIITVQPSEEKIPFRNEAQVHDHKKESCAIGFCIQFQFSTFYKGHDQNWFTEQHGSTGFPAKT